METSIPVVVDDIKHYESFAMTRCNYLTIQCDEPGEGWSVAFENAHLPLLMLGMTGIVTRPFDGWLFDDPDKLNALLELIEAHEGLYVDVDDIWLPNRYLQAARAEVTNGSVFRLGLRPFQLAYRYRDGSLGDKTFMDTLAEHQDQVAFSEAETEAFAAWHWSQIDRARTFYHARREQGLVLMELTDLEGPGHELT